MREIEEILQDIIAADRRVSATGIQTVGSKGYDGFVLARVIAKSGHICDGELADHRGGFNLSTDFLQSDS